MLNHASKNCEPLSPLDIRGRRTGEGGGTVTPAPNSLSTETSLAETRRRGYCPGFRHHGFRHCPGSFRRAVERCQTLRRALYRCA
jgi:hypothetical protein